MIRPNTGRTCSFVIVAAIVAAASLPSLGCKGDCEIETCQSFCADVGEAPDPSLSFETCVANAGATGGDFVLYDEAGEEVFSCYHETDALGQEVGSCSLDFAGAKLDYCGC